jgi:two-component system OmpR family sensor kinase
VSGSLQRQLTLTLAGVVVATGLVAAAASLAFGYYEAQEFQDDALRQVARVATIATPAHGGEIESSIVVVRLPSGARPAWLPPNPAPGLHTYDDGRDRMRAFVRALPDGGKLVAAQATEVRDDLALNSAVRTLVPLLLLIPLLAWLSSRVVARRLAPVRALASDLDRQAPDRLESLADAGVPDEIASFVHAINRLLERVNRLMAEQRRFIADAAHELRTPLAALSLQAQNVEGAGSLEDARARLAPLRGGIERARRLVEQLLSLAKMQSGAVETAPLDLSTFARELIAEYLPIAAARGIDLGMRDHPGLRVRATPEALRMIIGNALDNALRHAPGGGEVTLALAADGDDAVVSVIDNGPGIPAAERARVFDAFHRLEGAGAQGSGLGLAIARDAATRLGGEVSLHDAPSGNGLELRFRLRRTP